MNRIKSIVDLINDKECIVADIGSDHAFLSINLLEQNRCKFVYNIELNQKPLNNTIQNIKLHHLENKTLNVLNDGLKDWKYHKNFDYVVISGMGANSIIKILKDVPKQIKIKNFILVPNNHPELLRKHLSKYYFHYETIINENNYYYYLMLLNKTKSKFKANNKFKQYFGPYNLAYPTKTFIDMIKKRQEFIINNKLSSYNKEIEKELKIINDYLKTTL